MKKNRLILLIALALIFIALAYTYNDAKSTLSSKESTFAVADTSLITKIFLSDKSNHHLTLIKKSPGDWRINDSLPAKDDEINTLLKTIKKVEVKETVPKTARENVLTRLSTIGVKVEIYQTVYRIDFLGLELFPHEKLVKTYYVGDQTQNLMGTYMILEDAEIPYITHVPGFNGYLSSRFSPLINDWRDQTIFNIELVNIKSVKMEIPSEPEQSYLVENAGNNNFKLMSVSRNAYIANYDTTNLLRFLSAFKNIRYESMVTDFKLHNKDSIIMTTPYHILTVTDITGKSLSIKTFHKKPYEGEMELDGTPMIYDKDRLYALFNYNKDFAIIQFYVFDNILRPLSYFIKTAPVSEKK
ncbi:MAG TPA: DUF4340 domain-containing protein [Bacteroidales bacterium]|nr:DUF4340 domain-containing protein [Bacteroidales bacterium]HPS17234.1 DUF4340 domain-containing protein [Bacteroidales bacterium]